MPRTVSYQINKDNGSPISIIIEPVQTQSSNNSLDFTGVYALYKGDSHGVAHLLELQEIAPEIGDSLPLVEDVLNPAFLGRLTYDNNKLKWDYTGGPLSANEQAQVVAFIQSTK
ncbi:hypothetical protein ACFGVS_07075 [Mucilaginibacter sp. AW1-7]|jgi:hypothetical protein|uniref:hypothetical protein n=1 Tax=unclassified Mucilaginibacter TaxID=2617802 RepID=UPI0023659930|nr:hypothetical protein [Mucilaginibacter sp. KACC 22773]WDF80465.1 hypothetical protein PQ469_10655 [Mucilaginibacter sp. KACC 22773]